MSFGETGTFSEFIFSSVTNLLSLTYTVIPVPLCLLPRWATCWHGCYSNMAQNEGSCPSDLANYLVKFLSGGGKNGVKIKPSYRNNS